MIKRDGEYVSVKPNSVKKAHIQKMPPLRSMNIEAQIQMTSSLPKSVLELLKNSKPNSKLIELGVPKKLLISNYNIEDISLVTSYLLSEKNKRTGYKMELLVEYKTQFLWLMSLLLKPNKPYLVVLTSEENSPSSLILALHIANYYYNLSMSKGYDPKLRWYRSLEFIPYKKEDLNYSIVIVQVRWPSWVNNESKLYRALVNIRAAFENSIVLFIMSDDDTDIIPSLLIEEPFGIYIKSCMKDNILSYKKPNFDKINALIKD